MASCFAGFPKDFRDFARSLARQEWEIDENHAHPQAKSPDGQTLLILSRSPRNPERALSNLKAIARKGGWVEDRRSDKRRGRRR